MSIEAVESLKVNQIIMDKHGVSVLVKKTDLNSALDHIAELQRQLAAARTQRDEALSDRAKLIERCADLSRQLDERKTATDETPTAVLDAGIDAYRQHRVLRSTPHVTVRAIWRAFRTALEAGDE